MREPKVTAISINTGTIVKVILLVSLFYVLFLLRDILLIVLTAVVVASAVEPMVNGMEHRRIPRVLGVILIYLIGLLGAAFIFYLFVPIFIQDVLTLAQSLPTYLRKLDFLQYFGVDGDISWQSFSSVFALLPRASGGIGGTAGVIVGGATSVVLIIVLSFYLAAQKNGVANFLRLVTPLKHEAYVIDLWNRAQRKIGLWMQGQLLLGLIVALLTYLGLSVLGVRQALLLAVVAGVFEIIPVFGPVLAAIPAVAVGLLDEGVTLALFVTGLYVIIQQFESQLIHPLVVNKIVGIPPIVAIIALVIGAQLGGLLGIILSVPITAALMEYLSDIERRKIEAGRDAA